MLEYTPRTLRFDRNGIAWIVRHALELREGRWPGGLPSDYMDTPISSGLTSRAPFENPCLVIGELEIRIKRCGVDSYLVEAHINGKEPEEIAKERYLSVDYVKRRINKVLLYCASGFSAGWKDTRWRYGATYAQWKDNGCRFRKRSP